MKKNMKEERYLDINFIQKYFPNTLENIRAFREIKHGEIDDIERKYLWECMKESEYCFHNDLYNL